MRLILCYCAPVASPLALGKACCRCRFCLSVWQIASTAVNTRSTVHRQIAMVYPHQLQPRQGSRPSFAFCVSSTNGFANLSRPRNPPSSIDFFRRCVIFSERRGNRFCVVTRQHNIQLIKVK